MKKIVILGGTFNPVHKTHSYILEQALLQLNCDEKYYLINNIPPHKNKGNIANNHRLNMLKIQAKIDNAKIIDYELKSEQISYTYNTIKYLCEKWKNTKIYFLIGQDNINTLDTWYKIEKLRKLVEFIGVKRKGEGEFCNKFKINLITIDPTNISSTKVRLGEFNFCNKLVADYIKKHNLYQKD